MATELNKTNFVISTNAADTKDGMYLEQLWLLGWDNDTDWFTDIDAQDIMTPKGNVKKNKWGMIHVNRHDTAYVGFEQNDAQKACEEAIDEGYDCCICRLEKNADGDVVVFKV